MSLPHYASCNKCHAQLKMFLKQAAENCPVCGNLLKQEEFAKCKTCKGKVLLGAENCEGCKLSNNPGYSAYPPNSPGHRGPVNG